MTTDHHQPPAGAMSAEVACSHRSVAFWYSDTEEAGAALVAAAMQYAPQDRPEFLETAFRGAMVQLADANATSAAALNRKPQA